VHRHGLWSKASEQSAINWFQLLAGGQILEKQKYAAWKAVDIHKALSEGRKPVPGPPVDDSEGDPWNPEVRPKANISYLLFMSFCSCGTLPSVIWAASFVELPSPCLRNHVRFI
jgi:hypothetical protein